MKRWGIVWIIAVLSCIPIILHRASSSLLLKDTDTAYLLQIVRQRQDPWSWFTGDWPLLNHFYRPISTLTFEMDNALYRDNPAGYGLTNALLCCLCVVLLAWMLRELTDSIPITAGATALFGLWHWGGANWFLPVFGYACVAVGFFGLFRHGFKFWIWLPAVAAVWFLGSEVSMVAANLKSDSLYGAMIGWLPGRTASTMCVFCLAAMACYARYERLSAKRDEPKPTSTDEPAGTRTTVLDKTRARAPWIWAVFATIAGAAALASYEQAVMLPAALFGVAVSMRLQRYRVRWGWQVAFWGLLILYFLARKAFIPAGTSAYQAQQFRTGPGVLFSITDYLFASLGSLYALYKTLDLGVALLMTSQLYMTFWRAYANVYAMVAAYRHWVLALTGFALSAVAYLPMAWLNLFDHYHYWPMAMRSLYVVVLAWGTWELVVIAVSPPARKAPPRPSPAPGSLPRR